MIYEEALLRMYPRFDFYSKLTQFKVLFSLLQFVQAIKKNYIIITTTIRIYSKLKKTNARYKNLIRMIKAEILIILY
jgi:hypothetical protein